MKILFVHLILGDPKLMLNYSLGITSMAAVLKQAEHRISYLPIMAPEYLRKDSEIKNQTEKRIEDFKPDIIGISSTSDCFIAAERVIHHINRRFPGLFIIVGGVHATSVPDSVMKIKGVSGICLGEGEHALLELLERVRDRQNYLGVKNFWFKNKKKIIKNPQRDLIHNLDELPFEDLDIIDENRLITLNRMNENIIFPQLGSVGQADIMASRGCEGNCSYCFNSVAKRLYKNERIFCRRHSVRYVIEQIKLIKKRYKMFKIHFWDDAFVDDIEWLRLFSRMYYKEIRMPFRCLVRPNLTKEKIRLLKAAGCNTINIGVECGNDYIRNRILNRPWTKEQILRSCALIKDYKILLYVFSMVGCPGENKSTLEETYNLIKEIKPDSSDHCSIFKPYPGTRSYFLCKQKGWIAKRRFFGYFIDSQLNLPGLSRIAIKKYQLKIRALSEDIFSIIKLRIDNEKKGLVYP